MNIFSKIVADLRGDNVLVNRDDFFKYLVFELTKHEGLNFSLMREDHHETKKIDNSTAVNKKTYNTLSICLDDRKIISHTILSGDVIVDGIYVNPVKNSIKGNMVSFASLRQLLEPLYHKFSYLNEVVEKIKSELVDDLNDNLYSKLMLNRDVAFNYLAIIMSKVEKTRYVCSTSLEKMENIPLTNTYDNWYSFIYRTYKIKHGDDVILSCSSRSEYHANGEDYDKPVDMTDEDKYISFSELKKIFIDIFPEHTYLDDIFSKIKDGLLNSGKSYLSDGELLCDRLDYNRNELSKIFNDIIHSLDGKCYQKK